MPLNYGNSKIGEVYLGDQKLKEAYFGPNLVYSASQEGFSFTGSSTTFFSFWINDVSKEVKGKDNVPVWVPASNLTTMSSMFYSTSNEGINSLDVSKLDTSNVKNMSGTFQYLKLIKNLDLSNFDTTKVTDMGNMFAGCSSIKSLDLSSFYSPSTCRRNAMFYDCTSLESLDISNLQADYQSEDAYYTTAMFSNCTSLKHIKCSRSLYTLCMKYPDIPVLPAAMRSGGSGTWEIVG